MEICHFLNAKMQLDKYECKNNMSEIRNGWLN